MKTTLMPDGRYLLRAPKVCVLCGVHCTGVYPYAVVECTAPNEVRRAHYRKRFAGRIRQRHNALIDTYDSKSGNKRR